jgi:hypothetical protein
VSPELAIKKPEKGDMKIVRGPGSVVEATLAKIREAHKGQTPTKVMLTGMLQCITLSQSALSVQILFYDELQSISGCN